MSGYAWGRGNRKMERKIRGNGEGISLRTVHIAMIICAVVISLLLVFSTYQSASVFSALNKAAGDYSVRQKAAHELMEASDYLTEIAFYTGRGYPVPGALFRGSVCFTQT